MARGSPRRCGSCIGRRSSALARSQRCSSGTPICPRSRCYSTRRRRRRRSWTKPMRSLREVQRGFTAAALFDDTASLAEIGIVAGGLDPAARIAVYRNNVFGNYRQALAATYPVVRRLVGGTLFDAAVAAFARAYPSQHGDVNRYGGDMARFLAAYPPARTLVYLPDVARLEWALDQANIAADSPPLDLRALAAVPAAALGALRFALHPSVQMVKSRHPIFRIWQVNQPGYAGDDQVEEIGRASCR